MFRRQWLHWWFSLPLSERMRLANRCPATNYDAICTLDKHKGNKHRWKSLPTGY